MAIMDALNRLSNSQVVPAAATTVSAGYYDTGATSPIRRVGSGEPLAVVFNIESIVASADTYTFQVIQADNSALTSNAKTIIRTRVLTAAEIVALKYQVVLPIPPGTPTQEFIGASYITGASDALTVSADIRPLNMVSQLQDYATAIVIE